MNLGANGYATNLNGSFSLANATQFFQTNGLRYRLPGAALNASGLTATSLEAWFPTGFGLATSTNVRAMTPFAVKTNIALGPDLLPTTPTVTFTAASYGTNRLYFAEDTKPLFIGAAQIEWHIPQGEFYLAQADSLKFVRQKEDDDLFAQQANLVVPLAAERISNDGYYHNVTQTAGVPVYIRPDTNGAALLTMQATLQETEFRPHFPYLSTPAGGHIPVVGGMLTITNDLIAPATSYLLLAGPVPVPYARDCPPEAGCGSSPTIGRQVLSFTAPPGNILGLGQLGFTPDGGLLAEGTIPAANLTCGFAGGTNYCQRTADVSAGAYHVPGTFLRGDQSQQADSQRPAVLLFIGWGQPANADYRERPYSSAYDDGFANYAGLNFRAPATGRSFIAGMNVGPYPLTTRSKYYVRYGVGSGIHEAASFPANLALYGYAFTFQSYRLSYLDSANWESRTDGQVALPYPSAFNVEFERMKFLRRGNLDSAQLPANISAKHLAYWNADLKPLTLQFKPTTGDPCSLTTRYLVLGIETKLPFIPQAFQAALAFKNNGNLGADVTAVEGVDSRFAVPANLSLQGSGTSFYPLTTAAEGYFNNWETPGRPAAGFYNLVGRIRVPFFRDVKVQLHITPATADTAHIDILGSWPAEDGSGVNRGWNLRITNMVSGLSTQLTTIGPVYFPPNDDTAQLDYPLSAGDLLTHTLQIGCIVGTAYDQISAGANCTMTAPVPATEQREAIFYAGPLLATALKDSDPLLAVLNNGNLSGYPGNNPTVDASGMVAMTFNVSPVPLLVEVFTSNTWKEVGIVTPDTNQVYWVSYPACLIGPLPPFRGCLVNLPSDGGCDQHVARAAVDGPPSEISRFTWTPPVVLATVPWPKRLLPPVHDFDAGTTPPIISPRVAAVVFYDSDGVAPNPRYPIGVRLGELGIPGQSGVTSNPNNNAITDHTDEYLQYSAASIGRIFLIQSDPNVGVFRSLNTTHPGQSLLLIVVYREQLTNSLFPRVSGDIVQVTPLIERIPWMMDANRLVTIPDRLFAGFTEYHAPLYHYYFYVRDLQPVQLGAAYRYFVVRFNDQREIQEIVPAVDVALPLN